MCKAKADGVRVYSVKEVAERLGTCSRTIYREIQNGNLRHVSIGRCIRITDAQLAAYLAEREA